MSFFGELNFNSFSKDLLLTFTKFGQLRFFFKMFLVFSCSFNSATLIGTLLSDLTTDVGGSFYGSLWLVFPWLIDYRSK